VSTLHNGKNGPTSACRWEIPDTKGKKNILNASKELKKKKKSHIKKQSTAVDFSTATQSEKTMDHS
jgi:hypothetical protein